jgi:predicted nucleic acid-binding protein
MRLVRLDDELLESAAVLEPKSLRTLDAIHLATVLSLADDLEVVVTYDARLRAVVDSLGFPVAGPA